MDYRVIVIARDSVANKLVSDSYIAKSKDIAIGEAKEEAAWEGTRYVMVIDAEGVTVYEQEGDFA